MGTFFTIKNVTRKFLHFNVEFENVDTIWCMIKITLEISM